MSAASLGSRSLPEKPLLSILILTYNDGKYLSGCLESIKKNVSCPFEAILLHNGSSDPIPVGIEPRYPWLRIIHSEKNLGFNAGNNLAAKNSNGKYILLLNVDTILLTDVVAGMQILESNPRVAVIGAKSLAPSGEIRPSTWRFPRAWRLWLFRKLWAKPTESYPTKAGIFFKVDWVEGSFFMVRATDWRALGGFDERNPLFGNDIDYCRAATEHGLLVVHCPRVQYIHFGGYGVTRMNFLYAGFRGYHAKFSGPIERLVAELILRAGLIVRICVYGLSYQITHNHKAEEKWRRFADVYRSWAQMVV